MQITAHRLAFTRHSAAFCFMALCSLILTGCGGSNSHSRITNVDAVEESDDESPVNVIDQALPSIMIIPSDQLLQSKKSLVTESIDGVEYLKRDYQGFLVKDKEGKMLIRYVQDKFAKSNFPINDLEVCLKNLTNLEAYNEADGVYTDAKTMLLQTAGPNYVLELDYDFKYGRNLNNHNKDLALKVSLIDPITEKVLGTTEINGSGASFEEAVNTIGDGDFEGLVSDLQAEFARTIKYGREITVRIAVSNNANILLSEESSNGDSYADVIMDYMDNNTKKGTYSLQRNTDTEMYFTNVRISNLSENGTQTNAYNWGRQLSRELRNQCGVKVKNKSQKLNEVVLIIE